MNNYNPEKDSPIRDSQVYKHSFQSLLNALDNARLYTEDARSADIWDYSGTEKNVQMYTMKAHIMEQRNIVGRIAVKGTCIIKAPVNAVVKAIISHDETCETRRKWDPSLVSLKILDTFGTYGQVGHGRYKSPSWMFSDRDFAWIRDASIKVDQGKLQAFYLCGTSLSKKDPCHPAPDTSGSVRGEILVSSWVIKPFDESSCRCEIVADVDLCVTAWMPETVHKWISSDNIESLIRIKSIAENL